MTQDLKSPDDLPDNMLATHRALRIVGPAMRELGLRFSDDSGPGTNGDADEHATTKSEERPEVSETPG